MTVHELTCIGCPMGCSLRAEMEDGVVTNVTGNTCKRGDIYARKELTSPTRIVTSTVCVEGHLMASVKTKEDIPKGKIMDVIRELKGVRLQAPVRIGQVVLENVAGTGVPVIATKDVG
ncbi:MAG: DUF1667 domain-containing protein [Lachnospiraceae bacterium]|nr:DUF1667 domain-containing protein [Lachnospiraceae bacterium]MBR4209061.1 DUF1667 domain-containing protein [Lachnospiraceae bacterium]